MFNLCSNEITACQRFPNFSCSAPLRTALMSRPPPPVLPHLSLLLPNSTVHCDQNSYKTTIFIEGNFEEDILNIKKKLLPNIPYHLPLTNKKKYDNSMCSICFIGSLFISFMTPNWGTPKKCQVNWKVDLH